MRILNGVVILALTIVVLAVTPPAAHAQTGQTAMAPSGGLVNQALGRIGVLDGTNPGWLYYGINAADRGLGYNGSYMTLGGFIPMAEDDLGGFWAADLRGHLSEYGGFFSNVGAVRKQFLGGTLLGIGVYWDYDGDQNQYPTAGVPGTTEYGQFGHSYNQVGVSAEWLTNYGNLRSNGYIPVGSTAYTVGAPGYGFVGNNLLCQYGLDTALTGADLEVGAYIPGLSDWAGMISVGGYALGNARYDWQNGTQAGKDVVPWFGGVYTRLDMTFLNNWDFSLQANNDSYFDWTGFARLTYRMGGSRRRNVPDQMEQPMMRNEHIVRAHQTPIVAVNPENGRAWNVIHVDSAAAANGDGSVTAPVRTLADAHTLATNPYDVVLIHAGTSATTPYDAAWQFQADNQILVGEGSTLALNTASCGYKEFFASTTGTTYPVLTSAGTAITLRNGAIVDHLRIENAPVAIAGNNTLTGGANVNDVQIVTGSGQTAIQLTAVPNGEINLLNMNITNQGRGLWIDGGAADVTFQGRIASNDASAESILIQNLTSGTVSVNASSNTLSTPLARNSSLVSSAPFIVSDVKSLAAAPINVSLNTDAQVTIAQVSLEQPTQRGVAVQSNNGSQITFLNLDVIDATAQAFITENNTSTSSVAIGGSSNLASDSNSLPTFESNDDATLAIELTSLTSGITQTTPPAPPPAPSIVLTGNSAGSLKVTESFTVGGQQGSIARNVDNTTTTPVTVTVP
ncbi:MAG: hypothetical protein WCC69_04415 [Pirellulales bacterium]